ncbi:hypothetical protein, conserved [Plasmodium gonderi]|uniref:Uncharacterized protein n=1 Tax=Plasmodium gonderi TaxID=77519 RepID=A0A1Y1JBZ2_PLAGO|nr:hypothetical protein, conserved [Plasmodium gonderi]GAW80016.1 hypothetical protein, conserved [Plasmodium gonderi]
MLNEENIQIELVKLENKITKNETNFEKKKRKKKTVQFSDKNETIYYEKDENENSYFNFSINNFNYFECFYNDMYNNEFGDKGFKNDHSFVNEGDDKEFNYNCIDIFKINDSTDAIPKKDAKHKSMLKDSVSMGIGNVVRRTYVPMNNAEEEEQLQVDEGVDYSLGQTYRESKNGACSYRNKKCEHSTGQGQRFSHSFNEDSSFEVNDVHAAILNAEEKTINYSEDYFGYNIEPFNMKNELKEGYIDKNGNYVYNDMGHDDTEEAWLKSVDEEDPFTTFANKKIKAKIHNETVSKILHKNNDNENNNAFSINIYDALYCLSCLLSDKETPIKAMIRYKKDLKLCKTYLNECKLKLDTFNAFYMPRMIKPSPNCVNMHTCCKHAHSHNCQNDRKKNENNSVCTACNNKGNHLEVNLKRPECSPKKQKKANPSICEIGRNKKTINEETINEEAKNEEVKNEEVKNEEAKNEEVKNEAEKNEEVKNEEVKNEEVKNEEVKNEAEKNEEVKNEAEKNEEVKNEEVKNEAEKNELTKCQLLKDEELQCAEKNMKVEKQTDKSEILLNEKITTHEQGKSPLEGKSMVEKDVDAHEGENNNEGGDRGGSAESTENGFIEYERPYELHQLEEIYQKIILDYKTMERRFNNIIELTQKLSNEFKNVYFLTKNEFESLCKNLEQYKEENVEILWQLKWNNDANNNIYGPYNYYDIYNLISVGTVSAENPIMLRRINKENKVLENIWQMYDAVNYLIFVTNESVKKKRKLCENNQEHEEYEGDVVNNFEDDSYDIRKKKRKKKGLIQISKSKENLLDNQDDSDNEEDNFEHYD